MTGPSTANPFPAPPPPASPKPRRNVGLIVALVLAVPIGLLVLGGLLVGLGVVMSKTGQELPVGEQERAVVVTRDDILARTQGLKLDGPEKLAKKKLLDGTYELEYKYDASKSKIEPFFLDCMVTVSTSSSDASNRYMGMKLGGAAGFSMSAGDGVKLEDHDELFRWGDDSRSALITAQGKPVGNFFITRKGRYILYVIVVGVYFAKPETLADLLNPKLAELERYTP